MKCIKFGGSSRRYKHAEQGVTGGVSRVYMDIQFFIPSKLNLRPLLGWE